MIIVGIRFGSGQYDMLPDISRRGSTMNETSPQFLKTKSLIKSRIKNVITNNNFVDFDLLVTEDSKKYSNRIRTKASNLLERPLFIIDDSCTVTFTEEDGMIHSEITELDLNTLLPQKSLDQLMDVKKLSKNTDIGNRVKMDGANLVKDKQIDNKVETYEKFEKRKKKFIPGWNLKNIKPFNI